MHERYLRSIRRESPGDGPQCGCLGGSVDPAQIKSTSARVSANTSFGNYDSLGFTETDFRVANCFVILQSAFGDELQGMLGVETNPAYC